MAIIAALAAAVHVGGEQPCDGDAAEADEEISGLAPARKKSAPQTARTAWSGRGPARRRAARAVMRSSATASIFPGTSGRRLPSAKSQAVMTMKAGFMNSEGWIDMPARNSQRREPLISWPMKSTATISTRQTRSMISAVRRTWRGVRNESPDHQRQRDGA